MKPAICVTGLSKEYHVSGPQVGYQTLRESLTEATVSLARRFTRREQDRSPRVNSGTRRVLDDISFEVKPGEVVGIIGRNGAGKSTLLKILSRIVEPTCGRIEMRGRLVSLLEVGTGFHSELTGRENIFLNGSILGMSRDQIVRRFDEIVDFAGVGDYLDTPVKRYSSGMYVRLAFAVAAHLETDILVIDEILAVGDAAFQKKCLNKMETVGKEGRTVLFVSHNMQTVARLCPRALLLDGGRVVCDGPNHLAVSQYLRSGLGTRAAREWPDLDHAPGDEVVRMRSVRIRTAEGRTTDSIDIRAAVGIEMEFEVLQPGYLLIPNFHVYNLDGVCVFVVHDTAMRWRRNPRPCGRYTSTVWIPGNTLAEGTLVVNAVVSTHLPTVKVHAEERDAVALEVVDSLDGDTARGDYAGSYPGVVRPIFNWESTVATSSTDATGEINLSDHPPLTPMR